MKTPALEVEISKSGLPVLKSNGRFLASSFDPIKEAQAWAARAASEVGDKGAAVVLGAGCGYHLVALQTRLPRLQILALELKSEVALKALSWNPTLNPKSIVTEINPVKLTDVPELRDAMAGTYAILLHPPTTQAHPEWALNMSNFLLGRDKLSFLLQLRMRPDLYVLLDPEKIGSLGAEPISIKTLQRLFASTPTASRERRLWRVLEELVR